MWHSMSTGRLTGLRLDQDLKNRFCSRAYASEVLIAELGAAFLGAEFGFDGGVRHSGYIGNWVELLEGDERALFTACSQASEAADYLRVKASAEPADVAALGAAVSRPKRAHEAFFDIRPLPAPPLRFSMLTASDGGSRVGTGAGGGAARGLRPSGWAVSYEPLSLSERSISKGLWGTLLLGYEPVA
jgi:hypothetical protein